MPLMISLFILFSFLYESERGIFPQTEFVFDLELPSEFTPKNNDGEVDEFALVPADEVSCQNNGNTIYDMQGITCFLHNKFIFLQIEQWVE